MTPLSAITPLPTQRPAACGADVYRLPVAPRTIQFGQSDNGVPADGSEEAKKPSNPPPSQEQETSSPPQKKKTLWQKATSFKEAYQAFREFLKSDDMTLAKGLFFKKVVPLAVGFGSMIPFWGIGIAIAGIPVSYLSGRYGDKVMEGVMKREGVCVNETLRSFARIDELMEHPDRANNPTELLERVNKVIDDALDVKAIPGLKSVGEWLKPFVGKFLMKYNRGMLWATVNTEIAEAKSVTEAARRGVKGSLTHLWYFQILPTVGGWIRKGATLAPQPFRMGFQGLGMLLEWFGFLKLTANVATPGGGGGGGAKPQTA